MQVFHGLPPQPLSRPAALAFGNFDGVHVGHRALIAHLRAAADRLGGPLLVLTFDPHPLAVLRPERTPPAIDTLAGRLAHLAALGVDACFVLNFDRALAAVPAAVFAHEWLCQRLCARAFAVGPDVHFGRDRAGGVALLEAAAAAVAGHVERFGGVEHGGARVSSSRVRRTIAAGDVVEAEGLLARPFCLHGTVVHGDARGRTLGFPTANLEVRGQVVPAPGIYAASAVVAGKSHAAAVSIGTRPTFDGSGLRIEAHLIDFEGDVYGMQLDLHFLARLRDEARFADVAALTEQIRADVVRARDVVAARRPRGLLP